MKYKQFYNQLDRVSIKVKSCEIVVKQDKQIQMIKQFQLRILKLQQALQEKDKDFLKKKEHYERLIEDLQSQNQKLKSVIVQMNQTDNESEGPDGSNNRNKANELESPELSEYVLNEGQHHVTLSQYSQVVKQNCYLKQEIAEISTTYQKQIEQISVYFDRIKTSQRLSQSYAADIAQNQQIDGKISLLISAYQSLLKGFDSQRQKYTAKIQELSKYILWAEEKNIKLAQQKLYYEKKLKNSQETLEIFKRNLRL